MAISSSVCGKISKYISIEGVFSKREVTKLSIMYKSSKSLPFFIQVWFKLKVFCSASKNSCASLSEDSEGRQNWCLHLLKFQGGN